jgi:copper chaperone NosL
MKPLSWLVPLLLLLLAGCAASPPAEPRPPDIILGEDVCSECGMSITDLRLAAAIVIPGSQDLLFDDLAELVNYRQDHQLPANAAFFVHDYDSREWLAAEQAFYVTSKNLHGPMGGTLVAFAIKGRAETFASEVGGQTLDFATLTSEASRQPTHSHTTIHPTLEEQ